LSPSSRPADAPPPDAAAIVRFLQSPAAHAAHAGAGVAVETIETHMSWVFLAGAHAFKLKKAVRFPFLDFSSRERREFYCREELRLNRRLAPEVYRGLMALQWQDGRLALVPEDHLPPAGRTIDWLVWMRRLPPERMLDRMLAQGRATAADLDAVLARLLRFYREVERARPPAGAYTERFRRQQTSNREILLRPQFRLHDAAPVLEGVERALDRWQSLLEGRAAAGHLVDGHGDLRPEHVCLLSPPVVIDCLEFSPLLRQVDPFDELVFLGLECEMAGAPWVGPRLVAGAARALDDPPPARLLHLYTACRALLRARLAMAHLLDPKPRLPARWPPLAQRYLVRAQAALEALERDAPFTPATAVTPFAPFTPAGPAGPP
jgi:uncharacterized protein